MSLAEAGKNTRFGNGQDTSRGGRKKKIYTILKEKGYGKQDIKTAMKELAFYTKDELTDVTNNEDLPVIARIVSNQFLSALKDNNWTKIKEILEHVIGKPNQKAEVTHDVSNNLEKISFRIGHKRIDGTMNKKKK